MISSVSVGFLPSIAIDHSLSTFAVTPAFTATTGSQTGFLFSFSSGLVPPVLSPTIVPTPIDTFGNTPASFTIGATTTATSPSFAGSALSETLIGTNGADRIVGGSGNDALFGLAGNDMLFGGVGNDRLEGGPGDDTLTGGPGADLFVFRAGDGHDVITDFTPNGTVILATSSPAAGLAVAPAANPSVLPPTATTDELLLLRPAGEPAPTIQNVFGDALISFANGDSVRLVGVADHVNLLTDHII